MGAMPHTASGYFCDRLVRERQRRDGEGSFHNPLKYFEQNFVKMKLDCLHRKTLFEDGTFPATTEALGYKELGQKSSKVKNILWKRPKVMEGTQADAQFYSERERAPQPYVRAG